jgi:2-amino-4-hydroxy-6-hydroxymethyldihydropteridine diphosphokinase
MGASSGGTIGSHPPADSAAEANPPKTEVLLGLGANLGDPLAQLRRAVDALREILSDVRVSSVYRTEPVGHRDQPDFHNLVVRGMTELSADELLARILDIEREMGRRRTFRNAPRVMDVDLLAYGNEVRDTPGLVLPHPRMAERGFVLHPLAEVAPEWRHPTFAQTARELLSAGRFERVERLGPL